MFRLQWWVVTASIRSCSFFSEGWEYDELIYTRQEISWLSRLFSQATEVVPVSRWLIFFGLENNVKAVEKNWRETQPRTVAAAHQRNLCSLPYLLQWFSAGVGRHPAPPGSVLGWGLGLCIWWVPRSLSDVADLGPHLETAASPNMIPELESAASLHRRLDTWGWWWSS